jgi:hypothetical protein
MGIEALYRRPRTSIPARDAKIYTYLLDGLAIIERLWRSVKYEDIYLRAYENGRDLHAGLTR